MERREVLEAAFDKLEGDDDVDKTTPEPEKIEAKIEEVEAPAGGEKEPKSASDAKLGGETPEDTKDKQSKDAPLDRAAKAAASTVVTDSPKAPVSWKPAAKAQWEKLPVDIRAEVIRREKEMSQFVSQNDHHKKFTESFAQIVRPFQHLIQAQNSTPLAAVRNLMTTAAGLAAGTKQQKAGIVAEIISNYGVDIETLDLLLSGKANQIKQSPGDNVDPRMMQMLQPVYGFMSEVQQAREAHEQRRQQEAIEMVESFDKPFYDDVREDMADIMEISAKRGVQMTLEQAYEKAVALNPEVSEIIARQEIAEKAKLAGTRLAKARKTASTIIGGPAGAPDGKGAPKSRREHLEQAWEESTQH